MRGVTFRAVLFATAVVFSMSVVGVIAISTYSIFFGGISRIADERAERFAELAVDSVRFAAQDAGHQMVSRQASDGALVQFTRSLDLMRPRTGFGSLRYTLYDADLRAIWETHPGNAWGDATARTEALKGEPTRSVARQASRWSGLFGATQLRAGVSHQPVVLPDGSRGVLDVAYFPVSEERVINSLQTPMLLLAVGSTLLMMLVIQLSMIWVLRLIDQLRTAADSIDAGRLDERLPDFGSNEVGDLARSLNRLIDRLRRRSEAQAQFVANASHELATPVAGIRGYVGILRRWGAEDPAVREEAVEAIDRESSRMSRLTTELLGMLQSEGGLVFKSEPFDVNALVRERLAATANVWLEKDLEFVGPEEDELACVGDRHRLEDVLSILLENAAKYTPQGGTVAVRTARSRDQLVIEVSDTGQGIPPGELEHVFDRFYRSAASRAASEGGFGLGLSIAHNIVELAGGHIEVRSVLGEGATFTLYWPRGRR